MKLLSGQPGMLDPANGADGGFAAASGRSVSTGRDQALFRIDLGRSLQLHRSLALLIVVAFFALAALYLFWMWPIYTAQALVYVQPAPPRVMESGAPQRWPFDANSYETYIQQQMLSVTRPDVMAAALKKLDGSWVHSGESDQAAAERLQHAVEVARLGTSYQFSITAHASTPDQAAALANAVAAAFIESASRQDKAGDDQRLVMLREERGRVESELTADRAEQLTLNQALGVAAVGAVTPDPYDDDISRVREELVKARTAHDEAAARLTVLGVGRAAPSAALDAEAEEMVSNDAGLISLKTTLSQRRGALTSRMANLTPGNPQYKLDQQELAQIDGSLENMQKDLRQKAQTRLQQRLRNDLERTAGVEAQLNSQLGHMAAVAGSATPRMQRAADLSSDITRLQARHNALDDEYRNLAMEVAAPGAVSLSTSAQPPLHPFKSGVLRNVLLISLAGIFLALAAVVTANKLDKRVYIASDMERVLGFAPMAVLPDFIEVSDGAAEEHLLRLTAGIDHASQQGNLRSCIFTGAGPGTGVSTLASRVCSMLEAMGRGTVLVDASGAQPASSAHGSNGHRGSRSTALVAQLAEETEADGASLVITDTAPLTVSAETEYLARFVDAAIVVVESGATTREQLRSTANTLQRLDVGSVGFVLNRVRHDKADRAFRQSLQAIEEHLRAQVFSTARRTERTRPVPAPVAAPTREEPKPQPAAAEPAPVPPSRKAESTPPPPVIRELTPGDSDAEPFPFRRPHAAAEPEPVPAPRLASQRVAAEPAAARSAAFVDELPAQSWDRIGQPQPVPRREVRPPSPPQPEPVPPPPVHVYAEPVPEDAPAYDEEPAEASPATRLSGLRNILFTLGLQRLGHNHPVAREYETEPPPYEPPEPEERPAFVPAFVPQPEPAVASAGTSTVHIFAQPEFLPPRSASGDREDGSQTAARRDRRESWDDVDILPSWRGQYKKR
ncbi:MAG: hypothetical protein WCE75_07780 [Terracidiphilus sp.]